MEVVGLRNRFGVDESIPSTSEEKAVLIAPSPVPYSGSDFIKFPVWFSLRCNLENIDLVEQNFTVDGWINLFWHNPLIFEQGGSYINERKGLIEILDDGENQPLNPFALFENSISCDVTSGPSFRFNSKTGIVQETVRFHATFIEAMELERFPFDRQFLSMRLCLRTREYSLISSCPLAYVPDRLNMRSLVSYTHSPAVAGYKVESPVVSMCAAAGQSDDSRVAISLRVEREWGYWVSR